MDAGCCEDRSVGCKDVHEEGNVDDSRILEQNLLILVYLSRQVRPEVYFDEAMTQVLQILIVSPHCF